MATLQERNIKRVQDLIAEFQAGNPEGYLAGVSDDVKGSMLGGLIPGADCITNKTEFAKIFELMPQYMEVAKFEPTGFRAVGNDVLFNVNWIFTWKPTGEVHETTALVRKVVCDNMICEKYHMVDVEAITGVKSPHDASTVTRVQELLKEFMEGRPEGYLAGVDESIKANMLGGLIPGADKVSSKAEFGAIFGLMGDYMEVEKFEPVNFRALPNNDMMMNVNWKFTWKPTGKVVETQAIVRKVLKDGNICEKYHMVDTEAITQQTPRGVIEA